jgi:hypothetical protein
MNCMCPNFLARFLIYARNIVPINLDIKISNGYKECARNHLTICNVKPEYYIIRVFMFLGYPKKLRISNSAKV